LAAARFRRLIPPGGAYVAAGALAGWRDEPNRVAERPRVALNMVASVDGRVTIDGRSAPLSSPADRELFHALRAEADAVLAGARTANIERYGPIIRDGAVRKRRAAAGLLAQPLAVLATRTLDIDPKLPLLADAESHVVLMGPLSGELAAAAARVDYVRSQTLTDGLVELGERFGVGLVVCEGGPTLAAALLREGALDELFVSRSPKLVGGDPGPSLLADKGAPTPHPVRLALLLAHEDELYARYVVG
jgi:riboflavin biosynthesis pyrimidine reductase